MRPDSNLTRTEGARPNRDPLRDRTKSPSTLPAEAPPEGAPAGTSQQSTDDPDLQGLRRLDSALLARDYRAAARHVRECLATLPRRFRARIASHPPLPTTRLIELEQGGTAMALVGDEEGLTEMRRVVESVPGLERWIPKVIRHQIACRIVPRIEELIRTRAICLQSDMKHLLRAPDGHLVSLLVQYLEKDGRLVRLRSGRTWRLLPPDSSEIPTPEPPTPRPPVASHRTDRTAPLRSVELSSVPRIALPRALAKWELVENDRLPDDCPVPQASFEVRDADWRSPSVERMPPALRPDPAIARFLPSRSGVVMMTDRRWTDLGSNEASALHYDLHGRITARRTLPHGLLRAYCAPFGSALIGLSEGGVIHALDEDLQTILETPLRDAPELAAWKALPGERQGVFVLRTAISADADRYLFAMGNQVWCVRMDGDALWGCEFPDVRWRHAADYFGERNERPDLGARPRPESAASTERHLLARWGPPADWPSDGDPEELAAKRARWWVTEHWGVPVDFVDAYLTAADAESESAAAEPDNTSTSPLEPWRPDFVREISQREVDTPYGTCSIRDVELSENAPPDQIHDVAFSSTCNTAYIATMEGAVWAVNEIGDAVRLYDGLGGRLAIPSHRPRRIVHIGDYLYLLTESQLYVLTSDDLRIVIDVLPKEELYDAPRGFGLLSRRRIRWYRRDGIYLGTILSKHPIRRLYRAGADTVIETRTERAVFSDVPVW